MAPKVLSTYFQERSGVLKVATLLNAAGLVFRETPNADVGIDGQIELVDEAGNATGRTVAVQIKSGSSFLRGAGDHWNFYPENKHVEYWEMYPLPVLLMIHDPTDDVLYWADVRFQLRLPGAERTVLRVPKSARLSADSATELFAGASTAMAGIKDPRDVLVTMARTVNANAGFHLSYLDLFLEGMTDIGRKLFFSAGMCWDLAGARLSAESPTGVGMGSAEQEFLDGYIRFLVEQSLAHIDYSDVLIDVKHRQMFPTLLVPLTSRGRAVLELCRSMSAPSNAHALTEGPVEIERTPTSFLRMAGNFEVVERLRKQFGLQ